MNEDGPTLLRPEEVGEYLRMSRTKVYALLASGALPSLKIGKQRRVRRSDLVAFLQRLADEPEERPRW